QVLQGDWKRGLAATPWTYEKLLPNFFSTAVADVDRDGNLDVVSILVRDSYVAIAIFLSYGGAWFREPKCFPIPAVGFIGIDDFNKDGYPDIVITQEADHRVAILLGLSEGNFRPPVFVETVGPPSAVATGDFDGDDLPDLVVIERNSGTLSVLIHK